MTLAIPFNIREVTQLTNLAESIDEMNIMIEEILTRLPDYEVIEAIRFPSINRAMGNLRVKFTPGAWASRKRALERFAPLKLAPSM